MSTITEQQLQKKITRYLDARGIWNVKTINCNKRGVPDVLCCVNGVFLAIEVKVPQRARNVSQLQQYQIQKIRESGGLAIVAVTLTDVAIVVGEILEATEK